MSSLTEDTDIPQWKKDLIARLRNQSNRRTLWCPPQSPPLAVAGISASTHELVASVAVREPVSVRCNVSKCPEMVQDRPWLDSDNSSEEDLRYGPGIVSKLKNKYLSLTLREQVPRPSVFMRKAASLENILDEPTVPQCRNNGPPRGPSNRYHRSTARGSDMKRARSVETISRTTSHQEHLHTEYSNNDKITSRPKSLHEEMLINEGNDEAINGKTDNKKFETKTYNRINRPKRIQPIMNDKEKPPLDVVKQAKLIFERRPEQRTKQPQHTGEVAAKVATYKNIIVQHKTASKKPPIKHKPTALINDKLMKTTRIHLKHDKETYQTKKKIPTNDVSKCNSNYNSLPSPIPDISRIDYVKHIENENGSKNNSSLSETPDLILTSSPISTPTYRISVTENFLKEEIRHIHNDSTIDIKSISPIAIFDGVKSISPQTLNNINNASSTVVYNFSKTNKTQDHLPVNKNISNIRTPPSQPLKLEINGFNNLDEHRNISKNDKQASPRILQPAQDPINETPQISNNHNNSETIKSNLTILEIERNLINTAKTLLEQPKSNVQLNNSVVKNEEVKEEEVIKIQVPKIKKTIPPPLREPESNSIVFKFTDRKDVPDYVQNDGSRHVSKIEKPKVGEGGIILLPGVSLDESFTDEDDEILRSLEAPPSPCDVTFINDNILIDGKSSLNQKTKRAKMRISFVEAGPDIFEYPSESSLLIEEPLSPSTNNAQLGHTVPSLSGSSLLANYTPKSSIEDFQPGITRSIQNNCQSKSMECLENGVDSLDGLLLQEEVEKPILFSAGTNSDILF